MPWRKDWDEPGLMPAEAELLFAAADVLAREAQQYGRVMKAPWPLLWRLLWYTGRRVGEILALTPQDIGQGSITFVPLKQRRPRQQQCYCPPWLAAGLQAYALLQRLEPRGRLFPVTLQAVGMALERTRRRANIPRHLHPHMFRHGHARYLAAAMQRQNTPESIIKGTVRKALAHRSYRHVAQYLEPGRSEVMEWERRVFGSGQGQP